MGVLGGGVPSRARAFAFTALVTENPLPLVFAMLSLSTHLTSVASVAERVKRKLPIGGFLSRTAEVYAVESALALTVNGPGGDRNAQ